MKNTIAFIGFGDLGIQIYHILKQSNIIYDEIVVFDDTLQSDSYEFVDKAFPFSDYKKEMYAHYQFVIALGYKHLELKNRICNELLEQNKALPNIIHNTCYVSDQTVLGVGNVCYPMCNIDINSQIGNVNIFNNSVIISHDNTIGDANFFAPGFTSSGKVEIGQFNFFGSRSIISNVRTVGNNNIVCIGTVVTKNIPNNSSVIGNPMKMLSSKVELQ